MDPTGQTKAEAAVMALSPGGQTNLWEGLEFGLKDLSDKKIGQSVAQCVKFKPEPCR